MTSQSALGRILIAEDHPPTARLYVSAFEELDLPISTQTVEDGSECLAVMHGDAESMPVPDLVLLDLDMPEVSGFEVLEKRQGHPELGKIPVIVISGSEDPDALQRCCDLGANMAVTKPDGFEGYLSLVTSIMDYWFPMTELPDQG